MALVLQDAVMSSWVTHRKMAAGAAERGAAVVAGVAAMSM